MSAPVTTAICTSTAEDVFVRGRSLTRELVGHLSFTEMVFWQMLGRDPTPAQTALLDACLVTLMEHGLTPSAIAARMTYASAPEAMQGAVAAGLLSVGSVFVGTMDGCAKLLVQLVDSPDPAAEAERIARDHRSRKAAIPGFGHPVHRPDDPRSVRLFALADGHGVSGRHVRALRTLSGAVDAVYGRHLTINATGAVAAVLADADVPVEILRGIALIARCAGLVGHVHEEQRRPAMKALWDGAEAAVPYEPEESP